MFKNFKYLKKEKSGWDYMGEEILREASKLVLPPLFCLIGLLLVIFEIVSGRFLILVTFGLVVWLWSIRKTWIKQWLKDYIRW